MRLRSKLLAFCLGSQLAALDLGPFPAFATGADGHIIPERVTIVRCRSFIKLNAVQITFRVNGVRTASAVAFAVSLGPLSQTLTEAGTFSPGITIDRFFAAQEGLAHAFRPLHCAVDSVRYAGEDAS